METKVAEQWLEDPRAYVSGIKCYIHIEDIPQETHR